MLPLHILSQLAANVHPALVTLGVVIHRDGVRVVGAVAP